MMGLEPTTPCLQSQFEQDCYLGRRESAQLMAIVMLSVAVHEGPVMTAVNGTLVARPVRSTPFNLVVLVLP
jgi:hypothetical protein